MRIIAGWSHAIHTGTAGVSQFYFLDKIKFKARYYAIIKSMRKIGSLQRTWYCIIVKAVYQRSIGMIVDKS